MVSEDVLVPGVAEELVLLDDLLVEADGDALVRLAAAEALALGFAVVIGDMLAVGFAVAIGDMLAADDGVIPAEAVALAAGLIPGETAALV